MRRFLALAAGGLGLGALVRRRLRRAPGPPPESPADELRARLAESRALAEERDVDEAGETTVDAVPDPAPDERRREVHDRARKALDELQ